MIHLNEKTWQLPDTGMTFPFPTTNVLMYLSGQNETLPWDLSMPTTPLTYDYDPTCCTFSNTTGATTINPYDPGNSSINTGKSSSPYNYDNICGLHPGESRSTDKATYVDSNLHYYGYRYYSPEMGRWVSRDPIEEKGGINLYIFTRNASVDTYDFLGFYSAGEASRDCKSIIDYTRDDSDTVLRRPDRAITPGEDRACKEAIETAKKSDMVKRLWDQFDPDKGCPKPRINCKCCIWFETRTEDKLLVYGPLGQFWGYQYRIDICWNNLAWRTSPADELKSMLAEELTHALQYCKKYPGGCEGSLKKEMEGRYCSDECGSADECLEAALSSSCGRGYCDGFGVRTAYAKVIIWFEDKKKNEDKVGGLCQFYETEDSE